MASAPPAQKKSRLVEFVLIFAIAWLLSQMAMNYFFPKQKAIVTGAEVTVRMLDATVRKGNIPIAVIRNSGSGDLVLADRCPMPPFDVFFVTASGAFAPRTTSETAGSCTPFTRIKSGKDVQVPLGAWKFSLFEDLGTYELRLPKDARLEGVQRSLTGSQLSTQFVVHAPGSFVRLFRGLITKPLLNGLVFIADHIPGHDLGLSLIILTLLVKLLLFIPTQHSMEGQRKMQMLQPKLDAIRKQYEGNAKKQHEETMKLWKENNVNPLQSILPIFIQLPVLIGLYMVIREGAALESAKDMLYASYADLPWTFDTWFFGLDLTLPNWVIFAPALVVLQFIQMKLSFHITKRKKGDQKNDESASAQEMQQRVMTYMLPLMIGFFALRVPSAVSLYWGISTLFGIAQQMYVNREHLRVRTKV